jgi:hypothetical protein
MPQRKHFHSGTPPDSPPVYSEINDYRTTNIPTAYPDEEEDEMYAENDCSPIQKSIAASVIEQARFENKQNEMGITAKHFFLKLNACEILDKPNLKPNRNLKLQDDVSVCAVFVQPLPAARPRVMLGAGSAQRRRVRTPHRLTPSPTRLSFHPAAPGRETAPDPGIP